MMKWRSPAVLPGLILIALLFTGCAATGENTAANQVPVKVYFGAPDAERLVAEKVFLSQDALIMKRSMEILLGGPGNPALFAVVPAEAKVKSVVVKDRIRAEA